MPAIKRDTDEPGEDHTHSGERTSWRDASPRWFLLLVMAGSLTFGSAAGTIAVGVVIDSLSRIERYAKDEWQQTLAEQAEKIASVDRMARQSKDELERRAQQDIEFRNEIRREFDRLNLRLSKKGS